MSKIIEFMYPEYKGEEPDTKRIDAAVNYLIERAYEGPRSRKTVAIQECLLKRHFLNNESISTIAKDFNVSTAYIYQVRLKTRRMMRHPFIKKIIFDDETNINQTLKR